IAARFKDGASAAGRNGGTANLIGNAPYLSARFDVVTGYGDVNLSLFFGSKIVGIQQAAVFKNDGVGAQAGPLDVVFGEVGELAGCFRGEIVAIKIHYAVAVIDEINCFAV